MRHENRKGALSMLNVWRHNFLNPDPIRTKFVIALDIANMYPCVKFDTIIVRFAKVMIFYIFACVKV